LRSPADGCITESQNVKRAHCRAELASTVPAVIKLELCSFNLGHHEGDKLFSFELGQCIEFRVGRRVAAVEADPLHGSG
jgi:hypothetical protein